MPRVVSVGCGSFGKGLRVAVSSASSLLCLGSEQRSGGGQHMAERIEASSGLSQGGHSANANQRTDELKLDRPLPNVFSKALWICICAFFALIPLVAALNCSIALEPFGADINNKGVVAQCDAGCDSCNFSLGNGYFKYGTIECLPFVPCFVDANTDANLEYTIVNGSHASALTVYTNDAYDPWYYAVFHAPANRGDFRFEATNTQRALYQTTFHAVNSGFVDIVIHSDNYDIPLFPVVYSLFVYASTAEELNIWFGEYTRFSKNYDSAIQCPNEGKCKFESNGKRYEWSDYDMAVMYLIAFQSTDLQLLCGNSKACAGIEVHCGYSLDAPSCDLRYASDWQCVGTLNLSNGCPVPALSCAIDLSLFGANSGNMGVVAQCDAGCVSCNFSLANGRFRFGTIECLSFVPCFVNANTGADLDYTTVNGSHASVLTVYTNDAYEPWAYAVFHAPANRGDFRFEATNTNAALLYTSFHAVNTGVVDIVIHSDGANNPYSPELCLMFVNASTAEELIIWLGEETYFAKSYDSSIQYNSSIQCPAEGTCKWESNGQRYDEYANSMSVVNVLTHPSTDLQLLCGNSKACAGIHVECDNSTDTCEMQYVSDWQCVGTLNSGQCFANVWNPTTTRKPTTTTPMPTTTTSMPTTTTTTTPTTTTTTRDTSSTSQKPVSTTSQPTTEWPATEWPTTWKPTADTSTVLPQTSATQTTAMTTRNRMSTTVKATSDKSDNKMLTVYIAAGGFCAVVCFCGAVVAYFWHRDKLLKAQMGARDSAQPNDSENVAVDKRLIQAPPGAVPAFVNAPNESPIAEQPEDEQLIDGRSDIA